MRSGPSVSRVLLSSWNPPRCSGANAPRFPPLLASPIAPHFPPVLEVRKNTSLRFFNFILKFENYKDSKFFQAQITLVYKQKGGGGGGGTRNCTFFCFIKNKGKTTVQVFSPSSRV